MLQSELVQHGGAENLINPIIIDQQERAIAKARKELARMMYVKVQSAIQSYAAESGAGSDAAASSFTSDVSRQISIVGLKNTEKRDETE